MMAATATATATTTTTAALQIMTNASAQFTSGYANNDANDASTTSNNVSHPAPDHNYSILQGCTEVRLSQMEFFPWDNPDNIVDIEVEKYFRKFKNSAVTLLYLLGGPANLLNMAVFYQQSLKDRVNLCLFSLSLADFLYLTTGVILHGEHLTLPFGEYGPVATYITAHNLNTLTACVFVSFVLSAVIACERCLCVLNPLKFQTLMSTATMAGIVAFTYLSMLSLFFIVNFRYQVGCLHDPVLGVAFKTMVADTFYTKHKRFIDNLDGLFFGAGLTGSVMAAVVVATTITAVKLRQVMTWRSETTTTTTSSSSSSISAREVALTKMLIGSSVLFIICVFPTALLRIVCLFLPEMTAGGRMQNFFFSCLWLSEAMVIVNSTSTFCVYYRMGSRFRETFWSLCGKGKRAGKA